MTILPWILLAVVSSAEAGTSAPNTPPQTLACSALQREIAPEQDVQVEVVPGNARGGDVAVVAITVLNATPGLRRNVAASVIVPNRLESFLAGGTGGTCSNLLNNCIDGSRLSWSFPEIGPGQVRTVIFPAIIRQVVVDHGEEIPFSTTVNWDGGGGAIGLGVLRVVPKNDESGCLTRYVGASHRQLRVEVSVTTSTAKAGAVVPVLIRVDNIGSSAVRSATLRFVVPHRVESFLGVAAGGTCDNLTNNCYPGQIVRWDLGSIQPGEARSLQVPIKVRNEGSSKLPLCATANGENGGSGLACSVLYVK